MIYFLPTTRSDKDPWTIIRDSDCHHVEEDRAAHSYIIYNKDRQKHSGPVLLIRIRTFLPDPEPHLAIRNYLLLKKVGSFVTIP